VTIKSFSPITRERVQSLCAYLTSSFPESKLDETLESMDTGAVFIGIKRSDGGWLFVGVSGPAMTRTEGEQLSDVAEDLDLAAALMRAPEGQRVWIDVASPIGYVLRVTNRDAHSPDHLSDDGVLSPNRQSLAG